MKTRKQLWSWIVLLAAFVFFLQVSRAAVAQDDQNSGPPDNSQDNAQNDNGSDQDPPGRVARLNYSQGSISFRPAGENDWVTAVPNRPMVSGDDLWADENSRAEAHIGSTAIQLDSKTGITFLTLDDQTAQIRLAQGSMILRVRHVDDDDTYEVDAPNLAFTVLQPGEYRFDVNEQGTQTMITVWSGRGRVTGGGFTYTVLAHQSATFNGTDHLDYDLGQVPRQDDFDQWAFDRDDREDHADSANYVSREMTGYEDLDDYGDWSYVAGYGPCWRPRAVVVGWAPYRFGHWVFIGPWGWTWVEDEPWGFAPFHYGRWAFVNSGWFWVPGPVVVRPVWAPALVAFVGGGGFHVGVGVGVGWFPLAPGEVFVPAYRVSRTYVNNINITNTSVNVTKITNVYNTTIVRNATNVNRVAYVNQHVNGGVTVVSRDTFVNARPVAQNVVRVDAKDLESAPITHAVQAEPVRTSVMGAGRPAAVRPPTAVANRQVVALRTPASPARSIEQRQTEAGGHLNQALVKPAAPAQPANQGGRSQEGFRSFGAPSGGATAGGNPLAKPMLKPQPRVYEEQGTPQPPAENRNEQAEPNRPAQPANRGFQPPPQSRSTPESARPLVRPAPPVQTSPQHEQQQEEKNRNWQQQRPPAPRPEARPQPRPEPRQDRPKK